MKKKKLVVTFDINHFTKKNLKNEKLKKSARKIFNRLHKEHFNSKPGGWPLNFQIVLEDVYYDAYGEYIESYLMNEIARKKCYGLKNNDNNRFVIYKLKNKPKKEKRK